MIPQGWGKLQKDTSINRPQQLLDQTFNFEKNIFNTFFPNLKLPDLRIAIVGKSGAGKSSLINMLTNIFLGKKYTDNRAISIDQTIPMRQGNETKKIPLKSNIREFKDKQSDSTSGMQSQSQTTQANIYQFPSANCKISLIDTPGVGDTRGFEKDKENIKSVVEAMKASEYFNALCLVFKASDQRIDPIIKYLIDQYRGIMTKECQKNLIVCFTYVNDPDRIDALPALIEEGIMTNDTPFFCFENSCVFPPKVHDYIKDEEKKFKTLKVESERWIFDYENAQNMILTVSQMKQINSDTILNLYLQKDMAFKITNEQIMEVEKLKEIEKDIERKKMDFETLKTNISLNEDFTQVSKLSNFTKKKRTVTKFVKKFISKSTICIHHGICHENCGVEEKAIGQGDPSMKKCSAFWFWNFIIVDSCRKCGCHYGNHMHRDYIMQEIEIEEEYEDVEYKEAVLTIEQKKIEFEKLTEKKLKVEAELKEKQTQLEEIREKKKECFGMITHLCKEIQRCSLNTINHQSLLDYLDLTIQIATDQLNSKTIDSIKYNKIVEPIKREKEIYKEFEKICKTHPSYNIQYEKKANQLLKEAKDYFLQQMKDYQIQAEIDSLKVEEEKKSQMRDYTVQTDKVSLKVEADKEVKTNLPQEKKKGLLQTTKEYFYWFFGKTP